MKAYSRDLRDRVLADHLAGASFAQLGRKYTVSAEWVRQFIRRFERTGEIDARPPRIQKRPFHHRHEAEIRQAVGDNPSHTLESLRDTLGLDVSITTLWNALKALKISFKKTLEPAEHNRPDLVEKRHAFDTWRLPLDPNRFVFLDETWVKTNMTRLYGWGPTDRRVLEAVPHGHGMTTTFLAGLRSTGLVAPLVVDGAMTGAIFHAWVQQHLAPILAPGDIVVMDNLSSHKVAGVAEAIRAAGAKVVNLPPYSPRLNPIEQVFGETKNELRKRKPRTKADCDRLCGESLDWFTKDECENYIRHAGYGAQKRS